MHSLIHIDDSYIQDVHVDKQSELDEELLKYIQDLIEMISTEDEELNERNIGMLAEEIAMHGVWGANCLGDKQQIRKFLRELKVNGAKTRAVEERRYKLAKLSYRLYSFTLTALKANEESAVAVTKMHSGLQHAH